MRPRDPERPQAAIKRLMAAARNEPQIEVTVLRLDLEILLSVVSLALEQQALRTARKGG